VVHPAAAAEKVLRLHLGPQRGIGRRVGDEACAVGQPAEQHRARWALAVVHHGVGLDGGVALGQRRESRVRHPVQLGLQQRRILWREGLRRRLGRVDAHRVLGQVVAIGGDQAFHAG
jgi:hypothetical protein